MTPPELSPARCLAPGWHLGGGAVPGEVSGTWVAGFTLLDYVACVGTPDLLFAFADLFCPTLVVHDGRHFLAPGFSVATYDAWVKQGRTGSDIQRVMNHVHISLLFQEQEIPDSVAVAAARCVADIWSRVLGGQGIKVVVVGETFADAAVTFFED